MSTIDKMRQATRAPLFKLLAARGYTPVPIVPHNRTFDTLREKNKPGGKAPGRYVPHEDKWHGLSGWQRFLEIPPAPHTLNVWESWSAGGTPGAGILTGDVIAVDIDTTHHGLASAALRAARDTLGKTDFIRYGRAPKVMLIYRISSAPIDKLHSTQYEFEGHELQAVEVLGKGQQFVAYGIHPVTGQPYDWPIKALHEHDAKDLPLVTIEQLQEFIAAFEFAADALGGTPKPGSSATATNKNTGELADSRGQVPQAVASLSNEALHYDEWVRIGMAIKAALPTDEGLAFELFDEFSAKSDKYDADFTRNKWDTFNATRIGAGTLYHLAKEAGWQPPAAEPTDEFKSVDLNAPGLEQPAPVTKRPPLFYKKPSDIIPTLNHVALVEDLLDQGAMSVLYGESNTGKTFVAMDIAFHIATGKAWDGKRTQQGAVLYIAAEGGKSAENRIEALKKTHKLADFPLYLVPCPVDLLRPGADTKALVQLIQQAQAAEQQVIRLIVVDTLSRAIAGGNENSPDDMGAFVRNVDIIRAASGAHLMVVHHSGKDKAKGARGHSLLRAATDTELEVADKTITATKQRDMDMGKPVGFELRVVELGANAYGKPITSCVVQPVDARLRDEFDANVVLEARDAIVLNAFMDCLADSRRVMGGRRVVDQGVWSRKCQSFDLNRVPGAPAWPSDQKGFAQAFKRSRDRISSMGYVTELADKQWAEIAKEQSAENA